MLLEHPWTWWPSGGMWILPLIMMGVMLIACFLFMGRCRCWSPWRGTDDNSPENQTSESAVEILEKRFAKGELSAQEFKRMKQEVLKEQPGRS